VLATADHPFWSHSKRCLVSLSPNETEAKYGFSGMRKLDVDEALEDHRGAPVQVTGGAVLERVDVPVLTLTVRNHHWFFVNGVRVHNKGCFDPDTLVAKPGGSAKRLGDIKIGDKVTSWDSQKETAVGEIVDGVWWSRGDLYRIPFGNRSVLATADHPFWSHSKRCLVSLSPNETEAKYGFTGVQGMDRWEELSDEQGAPVPLTGGPTLEKRQAPVVTLTVRNNHWFFVNGVRVHNKGCFHPGTAVTLADGTTQEIGRVRVGDSISSWDAQRQQAVGAAVAGVWRSRGDLYRIAFHNRTVLATADHPFWSSSQNGLVSLDPGRTAAKYGFDGVALMGEATWFLAEGGRQVPFLEATLAEADVEVVTLTVHGYPWFFAEGILVHNKGGIASGEEGADPFEHIGLIILGVTMVCCIGCCRGIYGKIKVSETETKERPTEAQILPDGFPANNEWQGTCEEDGRTFTCTANLIFATTGELHGSSKDKDGIARIEGTFDVCSGDMHWTEHGSDRKTMVKATLILPRDEPLQIIGSYEVKFPGKLETFGGVLTLKHPWLAIGATVDAGKSLSGVAPGKEADDEITCPVEESPMPTAAIRSASTDEVLLDPPLPTAPAPEQAGAPQPRPTEPDLEAETSANL